MSRENDETKRRERGRRVKDPPIANLARTMSVYTLSERYISINAAHQDGTVPPKGTTTTFHFTFCYVVLLFFLSFGDKTSISLQTLYTSFSTAIRDFLQGEKERGGGGNDFCARFVRSKAYTYGRTCVRAVFRCTSGCFAGTKKKKRLQSRKRGGER